MLFFREEDSGGGGGGDTGGSGVPDDTSSPAGADDTSSSASADDSSTSADEGQSVDTGDKQLNDIINAPNANALDALMSDQNQPASQPSFDDHAKAYDDAINSIKFGDNETSYNKEFNNEPPSAFDRQNEATDKGFEHEFKDFNSNFNPGRWDTNPRQDMRFAGLPQAAAIMPLNKSAQPSLAPAQPGNYAPAPVTAPPKVTPATMPQAFQPPKPPSRIVGKGKGKIPEVTAQSMPALDADSYLT